MSKVFDVIALVILEDILVVSETVSWVAHYFSNSFQKLAGNEYSSKPKKEFRFQVIYNSNISYFLEFPLDI